MLVCHSELLLVKRTVRCYTWAPWSRVVLFSCYTHRSTCCFPPRDLILSLSLISIFNSWTDNVYTPRCILVFCVHHVLLCSPVHSGIVGLHRSNSLSLSPFPVLHTTSHDSVAQEFVFVLATISRNVHRCIRLYVRWEEDCD